MKKKAVMILLLLLLVVNSIGGAFAVNAAQPENYSVLVDHGVVQETKRFSYEYWLYDADSRYYYTFDYKKLTTPVHWGSYEKNLKIAPYTISITQGDNWSSSTSEEFSMNTNFRRVSTKIEYKNVISHTITREEAQTHSTTLSLESPDGYYYWAAIMDYEEYSYYMNTTEKPLISWLGQTKYGEAWGRIKTYLHEDCWLQFVYQEQI